MEPSRGGILVMMSVVVVVAMAVVVSGRSRLGRQRARLFFRGLESETDKTRNDHEYC
jgi:hypothetical protein